MGDKSIDYICIRSLQLNRPVLQKSTFNKDSIAYITKSFKLRTFSNKYNTNFWENYESTKNYPVIPKQIKIDLEHQQSLKKQFEFLNLPIDSLVKPIANKICDTHIYHSDTLVDNYNWLASKGNKEVIDYLKSENKYYYDVLYKINDSIKGFHYRYNTIFKSIKDTVVKKSTYFSVNNEQCKIKKAINGHLCLYQLESDSTELLLLDITQQRNENVNFYIEGFKFSDGGQFSYHYSVKGGFTSNLVVKQMMGDSLDIYIPNIKDYYWLNDSVILYLNTDKTKRTYQLRTFELNTNRNSLIYEEKDKTFGLHFETSTSGEFKFLVAGSLLENEYYVITKDIDLDLVQKSKPNHYYSIDHHKGAYFYGSTNRLKSKYEIVRIPIKKRCN